MGTFEGHIVPGLALTLMGIWHTVNTIRAYCLRGSTKFTIKYWYPFYDPFSKFKHLELLIVFCFSVISIAMLFVEFPPFRFSFKLVNFEHATMFLHLVIFAAFTLFAEVIGSAEILSGFIGILAASVFGQEFFLLHFHSADHVGLEGHYHWLLQLIVFISLLAAICAVSSPTSFPASLVLSMSVIFQGLWFINMGFILWFPAFVPNGCHASLAEGSINDIHGAVTCGSLDADLRARSLANLQFSWILAGILLFTGCVFLKLAGKCTRRRQSTEYEQLHTRGTDVPIIIGTFKVPHP